MAGQQSKRRRVVVIDAHDAHRQQVAGALRMFYEVSAYAEPRKALVALGEAPPAAVIIDESVARVGDTDLIALMRTLPGLGKLPIILTAAPSGASVWDVRKSGADAFLEKPFRRSVLLRGVSDLINTNIEHSWRSLPAGAGKALRSTVDTFNQVADGIARGEPVPFATVKDACGPLVDAVTNQDYWAVLEGVRGHDNLAYTHALRVGTLLSAFGHNIGLRGDDLSVLASGGLLHDIGLLSIPPEIRYKAGPLTPEETTLMRGHVKSGVELLKARGDVPKGVLAITAQHHERLNGTGYPEGLDGSALNDLARMAAIVDVFAELTDETPNAPSVEPEEALKIMAVAMKRELDPKLVGLFTDTLLAANPA
jgi:putative nucleotidyltransferase with HDIG domain